MRKQPTLADAIALAQHAHEGQTDKAGAPYYNHLQRVMDSVEGEELKTIAVLHDSLEDTFVTRDYLCEKGYPEQIVAAVEALTKQPDEEGSEEGYTRFIERAAQNPLARVVKIADLRDNMDLSRLSSPTAKDHARLAKYQRALTFLEGQDKNAATSTT